ncbi:MAG: hypothetical protein RL240_4342 [Planctomycetota bacterium]
MICLSRFSREAAKLGSRVGSSSPSDWLTMFQRCGSSGVATIGAELAGVVLAGVVLAGVVEGVASGL